MNGLQTLAGLDLAEAIEGGLDGVLDDERGFYTGAVQLASDSREPLIRVNLTYVDGETYHFIVKIQPEEEEA